MVRRVSVKNLADRTHGLVLQGVADRVEHGLRRARIATDTIGSEAERSEQPPPNRALMIAAVALQDAATIVRMVCRAAGRQ